MAPNTTVFAGILIMLAEFGPSADWQLLIRLLTRGYTTSEVELGLILNWATLHDFVSKIPLSPDQPLEKYELTEIGRNLIGIQPRLQGRVGSLLL